MTEQRDPTVARHQRRVGAYVLSMARWLVASRPSALPEAARSAETIAQCAVLHDIGKVCIQDDVLLKAGPLDELERQVMRTHPTLSAAIIKRLMTDQPTGEFLRIAHDIALNHHEAFDGSGYPHGLRGDDIPLVAQLAMVADVFDDLTTTHAHRPDSHDVVSATRWIVNHAGTLFHPVAVLAFEAVQTETSATHALCTEPSDRGALRVVVADTLAVPQDESRARDAIHEGGLALLLSALLEQRAQGAAVITAEAEDLGRIQIHGGTIVWIGLSNEKTPLSQRLASQGGLAAAAVRAAVDECDRSIPLLREHVMETACLDDSQLREAVRVLLARKLACLSSAHGSVVTFVTDALSGPGRHAFTLEELVR